MASVIDDGFFCPIKAPKYIARLAKGLMRRNTSLSDRAHLILFLFYFEFASFHFDAEQQRELAATLRARAKYYLFGVVSCKY